MRIRVPRSPLHLPRWAPLAASLVALAPGAWAGDRDWALPLVEPGQDRLEQEPELPPPAGWHPRSIELNLSDESVHLAYLQRTREGDGTLELSGLVNEEDDVALVGRFLREAQVVGEPIRLGVGISVYAVFVDASDEEAYAVALTGLTELDVPDAVPTTVGARLSVAPRITTFDDGEDLFDLELTGRFQLSPAAAAQVGFRAFEVETETDEFEIDESFFVGVRIGL